MNTRDQVIIAYRFTATSGGEEARQLKVTTI